MSRTANAAPAPDTCGRWLSTPVSITEDSVGPLNLHHNVGELRKLCPSARDTVIEGEESTNQAVAFHIDRTTAVAMQTLKEADAPLDAAAPADLWLFAGVGAVLPEGISLGSRWGNLRAAYGRAGGSIMDQVAVGFCRYPRIQFDLQLTLPDSQLVGYTNNLSAIPDTAAIRRVWLYTGRYVDARTLCRPAGDTAPSSPAGASGP